MDRSDKGFGIAGFVWGLAEAICFFIVPDVILCFAALKSIRCALFAVIGVVLGACVGAGCLYAYFFQAGPNLSFQMAAYNSLHHLWSLFPGFRPRMALVAQDHLVAGGAAGLLSGPRSGIPYRVYVAEAAQLGIPLTKLLVWTPLARLERIWLAPFIVTLLRLGMDSFVPARFPRRNILVVAIVVYWICLYAWYWGKLIPSLYG